MVAICSKLCLSNIWSLSCGNVPASRLMVLMEQRFRGLFVYLLINSSEIHSEGGFIIDVLMS